MLHPLPNPTGFIFVLALGNILEFKLSNNCWLLNYYTWICFKEEGVYCLALFDLSIHPSV